MTDEPTEPTEPQEQPEAAPDESPDTPPADDIAAKYEALKRVERKRERDFKRQEKELAELRAAQAEAKPAEPDPVDARIAAADARLAAANQRIVRAAALTAAAEHSHDPDTVARLLDLNDFDVADDGTVDVQLLTDAVGELLDSKPYLRRQTAPEPAPERKARDNDGLGARRGTRTLEDLTVEDHIARINARAAS